MARIRSIKPEFWTSEQIMECSPTARLLFIGMWNFADDEGRMAYSPRTLKAQVLPGDPLSTDEVSRLVDELSANGLVLLYAIEGKQYLQVTGWHHQKIDKAKPSRHPRPVVEQSRPVPVGREGKGVDLKGEEGSVACARERVVELQVAIVKAFEAANSPNLPDTSRAELWLSQGYDPAIIVSTIRTIVAGKPAISSLNYFDKAIREAHQNRAPPKAKPKEIDWDARVKTYREKALWPSDIGPEPGYGGCRAPVEILRKHGFSEAA